MHSSRQAVETMCPELLAPFTRLIQAQYLSVLHCTLRPDSNAGEESIKAANQQRFEDSIKRGYATVRQERLASAEVACRRLISEFSARITQVSYDPQAAQLLSVVCHFVCGLSRLHH